MKNFNDRDNVHFKIILIIFITLFAYLEFSGDFFLRDVHDLIIEHIRVSKSSFQTYFLNSDDNIIWIADPA